jgi:hypothetical protein
MPETTVNAIPLIYDRIPDVCPICHHALQPIHVTDSLAGSAWPIHIGTFLEMVFKCPRHECSRLFIGRYRCTRMPANFTISGPKPGFEFQYVLPFTLKPPELTQEIKKLSPTFVEIYGQAAAAEQYGLGQIAGVGYRKALEFLIKDYCISRHPDKAEEIKSSWLATCIRTYVDDANTKRCAERAVWLGNDETHYVRRWEDKDIGDLKTLITLTMAWIQNNLLTEKYLGDMPPAT